MIVNRRRYMGNTEQETLPYLKFTALEDGTFKHNTNALEYSLDEGRTWVALSANTDTPTIHTGESVCWRGTINTGNSVKNFSSTGYFDASGDPRSVIYSNNFSDQPLKDYCFNGLFSGCDKLVNAKDILLPTLVFANRNEYTRMFQDCTSLVSAPALPATTLSTYCYYYMFSGCTSLVTAPVLNATSLAQLCYSNMFNGCSSLINVQASLPATTLAASCYLNMFYYCTSLATAPALPATTLETACYRGMFEGCTSLTTAPDLPATTLCDQCYFYLFRNCSNLSYIKALFVNITGTNPLYSWVYRVASNGTFVKASGATIPTGTSGIPSNWTVQEVSS